MRKLHKSGFTLIELLIVTVVVASLMAIVFRLAGVAGGTSKTQKTVARMQRLENCLSGYYAAFGSYPPVPLQGMSRDIFRKAMNNGIQGTETESKKLKDCWKNVEAACMAQPVAAFFPTPNGMHDEFSSFQNQVQELMSQDYFGNDTINAISYWVNADLRNLNSSAGGLDQKSTSFNKVQLFRYGVMSFLLPRYMFMLDCVRNEKNHKYSSGGLKFWEYAQWTEFNPIPSRMRSGTPYESWEVFCEELFGKEEWEIELIPSQAACARWLSNLVATPDDKDMVSGLKINVFGFEIGDNKVAPDPRAPKGFKAYGSNGYSEGGPSGGKHSLFFLTVRDGWNKDFYYYSPPPYQTYVLWSGGANQMTIPPWVNLKDLDNDDYKTAVNWMSDDIKGISKGK